MFNESQPEGGVESRAEHLKAARGLAEEMAPRLEAEFPLVHAKLNAYLENDFVDDEGNELDAGEMKRVEVWATVPPARFGDGQQLESLFRLQFSDGEVREVTFPLLGPNQ